MMENKDQTAPRSEGAAEGSVSRDGFAPREGKRAPGRGHHRRAGDRSGQQKASAGQGAGQADGRPVPAADARKGNRNDRGDRRKSGGNTRSGQMAGEAKSDGARPTSEREQTRQDGRRSDDRRSDDRRSDDRRSDDRRANESRFADGRSTAGQQVSGQQVSGQQVSGQQTAGRQTSDRPTVGRPSSGRPSAGRPQRTTRHAPAQNDLPDMNDLLIDDAMSTAAPRACARSETDAAELERILATDLFARPSEAIPDVIPEDKVVIVGIRFRAGGKTYFFDPGELDCRIGRKAVVETARGQEFGEVCIANRLYDRDKLEHALSPIIRLATEADVRHNEENIAREEAAFRIGVQKIAEHGLDMKLVNVQYTFDNSKLLFYFTSAKRVDFRDLVKDLAGVFHIRIELRQIGIRDEARMLGGLGACGRPLCCSTFLNDFGQVSMKMAKEQNLSLNSSKISGCCGRLMCCLRYEYETYAEEIRRTPAPGTFVSTPDGPGVITEIYPLQGEVKVSLRGQTDSAPKRYSRDAVEPMHRARPEAAAPASADGDPDTAADAEETDTDE